MCKGITAEEMLKKAKEAKAAEEFRIYEGADSVVERHYYMMKKNQTVDFVRSMHERYSFESGKCRARMTVREAFAKLENYVDASDPDLHLPNLIHMLQTAEGLRRAGKPDWYQLTGLIHDMGKIMFLWGDESIGQNGTADGAQWALGGDTWVVGCRIPEEVKVGNTYPEFAKLNPDMQDPRYNTKNGMYQEKCGIDNLLFAYGHDEYLYQMLVANKCPLPKESLDMVRYHSAYTWHTARCYDHFMKEEDFKTLELVLDFNKYDLYTKDEDNALDVNELWPYYQGLIDKYMPGQLLW